VTRYNETQPGYTLAMHCAREETMNISDSLNWDFVIMQEQGGLQAFPETMIDTAVFPYLRTLIDVVKRNSNDTKIILYMAHAYREGVLTFGGTDWAEQDPEVYIYRNAEQNKGESFFMLNMFEVEVAPGGILWKIFQDGNPEVDLFNADGIHPLPNGSYLLACNIYSTIFCKSPLGKYIPAGVNSEEANNIQHAVYEALFKLNPEWKKY
jgi:hypothetical protein